MKKIFLLLATHSFVLIFGFALGVYLLPEYLIRNKNKYKDWFI